MDSEPPAKETSEASQLLGDFSSKFSILGALLATITLVFEFFAVLLILFLLSLTPDVVAKILIVLFLFIFMPFPVIQIRSIVRATQQGKWRVRVFPEGMLITLKGEDKLVHWPEITSFKQSQYNVSFGEGEGFLLGTSCTYTIKLQDGTKYIFHRDNIQELGKLISYYWKKQ